MTVDTANSIACSLVNTRLDYANSLLSGISQAELAKLRRVQNTLVRVVLGTSYHSETSLLHLHCLPFTQRVQYKITTISFKVLTTREPSYLNSLI